jgi:predicted nucleic acid-binding protein
VSTRKRGVTFDTGALIALERRKASALALLRVCRQARVRITVPAAVVAEWWRGTHSALLEAVELEPLSPRLAKAAGELLARAKRSDTIDATVIVSAALRGDLVVTDDPHDLKRLAALVRGVDVMEI